MHAISECLNSFEALWMMAGDDPINWMTVAGAGLIITALLLALHQWLQSKVEKVGYAVELGGVTRYYRYK